VKKRWHIIFGVALLAIILLFVFLGKMGDNPFPVAADAVERIELKTYSHTYLPGNKQAELSRAEANKIIRLINWSGYDPQITGEPCCDTYWLEIYFVGGAMLRVSQGGKDTMIVNPLVGERYWVRNQALVSYVLELIETYELERN
jgi:hypothetical protein